MQLHEFFDAVMLAEWATDPVLPMGLPQGRSPSKNHDFLEEPCDGFGNLIPWSRCSARNVGSIGIFVQRLRSLVGMRRNQLAISVEFVVVSFTLVGFKSD